MPKKNSRIRKENSATSKSKKAALHLLLSISVGLIFAGVFSTGIYILAAPPSSPYNLGETLNPNCSPDPSSPDYKANCTVAAQTPLTFSNSLSNSAGNVTLSGDTATPGDSKYYGTNNSGTRGFYTSPFIESSGTIIPTTASDRVLIGGARDDGRRALQVQGDFIVKDPTYEDGLLDVDNSGGFAYLGDANEDVNGTYFEVSDPYQSMTMRTNLVTVNGASGLQFVIDPTATYTPDGVSALQVHGNINITGQYLINGSPIGGTSPWDRTSSGGGFYLSPHTSADKVLVGSGAVDDDISQFIVNGPIGIQGGDAAFSGKISWDHTDGLTLDNIGDVFPITIGGANTNGVIINPGLQVNGNTQMSGVINDGSSLSSIDPNNRILYDSDGSPIFYYSGPGVANFFGEALNIDNSGNIKMLGAIYQQTDSSPILSIDPVNRELISSDGSDDVLNWSAPHIVTIDGGIPADTTSALNVNGALDAVSYLTDGADIAENYPTNDATLSPGEIVALDTTDSTFVVRANAANSAEVIGIVSTAPGMKLGVDPKYKENLKVPVALAGRVPVKVDMEGGAINIGDRIALSPTTPGTGMKASAGMDTIGIALESFNGLANLHAGGSDDISGASGAPGTILVFVQNQQYNLSSGGSMGNGQVAGVSGATFLQSVTDSLTDLGITVANGAVKIATLAVDNLNVKTARVQDIEIVATNGDIYCTWIDDNGDWQKVKGMCAIVGPEVQSVVAVASTTSLTSPNTNFSPLDVVNQATQQAQNAVAQAQNVISQAQQTTQQAQQAAATAQNAADKATQASHQAQEAATTAQQAAVQAQGLNIVSLAPIGDMNVAYGLALSAANLPATVEATMSDGTTQAISVTWDDGTPVYNPNVSGTYVFSGALGLPNNISNTDNLAAAANVIVGSQPSGATPAPAQDASPSTDPVSIIGILIQQSVANVVNGFWGFGHWILNPIKKIVPASSALKNTTANMTQGTTAAFSGLLKPFSNFLKF